MKLKQKKRSVEDVLQEVLERLRMVEMHVCPHDVVLQEEDRGDEWVVSCADCGRAWCGTKAELKRMFGRRLRW